MKYKVGLVLMVVVFLGGCATMLHGPTQQVAIRSNLDDVKLYVNEQYIGKGSGVTTFKKNKEYSITARKDGCEAVTIPVSKSFDATTLLGLFVDFGVITILVVDGMGTGAWQQFDQTTFVVDPKCPA